MAGFSGKAKGWRCVECAAILTFLMTWESKTQGQEITRGYPFSPATLSSGGKVLAASGLAREVEVSQTLQDDRKPGPTSKHGLKGAYYADPGRDFSGEPRLVRIDGTVDFDWANQQPDPKVPEDQFQARWTGHVEAEFSEKYTFHVYADDGVRLRVDGKLLFDDWTERVGTRTGSIDMKAGQRYAIVLEYFEAAFGAVVSLSWSSASRSKEVIPTYRLYPEDPPKAAPKPPVPEQAELRKAQEAVRDRFKEDYRKPSALLARRLYQEGRQGDLTPVARFALLTEAREMAVKYSDPATALEAIDSMADDFVLDWLQMKAEALKRLAGAKGLSPQELKGLAETCLRVAKDAAGGDQYDVALSILGSAQAIARNSKSPVLGLEVADVTGNVKYQQAEFKKILPQVNKLKEKADDADAYAAVGRFLCLVKGNFLLGLDLLKKGSDPELKSLADQESAESLDPDAQAALGKRWREVGDKQRGAQERKNAFARARLWYEKALPRQGGTIRRVTEGSLCQLWVAENGQEIATDRLSDQWAFAGGRGNLSEDKDARAGSSSLKIEIPANAPTDFTLLFPKSKRLGVKLPKRSLELWFKETNTNPFPYFSRKNPTVTFYESASRFIKLTPKENLLTGGFRPGYDGWSALAIPLVETEGWVVEGEPIAQVNWFTIDIGTWENKIGYSVWIDGLIFR